MKTKSISTEIEFHALSVDEIVSMIPLMDDLVNELNGNFKYYKEEEEKRKQTKEKETLRWYNDDKERFYAKFKRYNILKELGFKSQIELVSELASNPDFRF